MRPFSIVALLLLAPAAWTQPAPPPAAPRTLAEARAQNGALSAAQAAATAELARLKTAAEKSAEEALALRQERDRLALDLAASRRAAATCQAKNARLVAFAEGLLNEYERVRLAKVIRDNEPFVGFARVRLENLVQDREDQIRSDRCNQLLDSAAPPAAKSALSSAPSAAGTHP